MTFISFFRLLSKIAKGVICGFGIEGYIMSLKAMGELIKNENWQKINQGTSK